MPEAIVSQLPSGAGRFQDFIWPDPMQSASGAVNSHIRGRINGVDQGFTSPGSQFNIGGGTGGNQVSILQGVPCAQLVSAVGAGVQYGFYPGFHMALRTSRSAISPICDDCFVYRLIVIMAGPGVVVANNQDFGFEVVRWTGALARLAADGADGFGIRLADANTAQLIVHGPNGLVATNLTAAPFDTTIFHTYEFRVFQAGPTSDAFLTLRLDGAVIALSAVNSNFAAPGTNLPATALTGNFMSFVPTMVSGANQAANLFVQRCRMIAAPSELMTL